MLASILYEAHAISLCTTPASGKPGKAHPVPGSTFLNGIAVAKDGTVYVSNTREKSQLYKITPEGEAGVLVEGGPLVAPNGVAIDTELTLMRTFQAVGLPLTILFDKQGREFARAFGPQKWDDPAAIAYIREVSDIEATQQRVLLADGFFHLSKAG